MNLIYGIRPVIEAINSGKTLEKIFIQKGLRSELLQELMALLRENNLPVQYVPVEKINKLAPNNNQGVVAFLSKIVYQDLDKVVPMIFEKGKVPLVLILDRITDVRNFGAIARTAECAGVDAIIVPDKGSAQINEDGIKTSAGALMNIDICRESNLKTTIHFLKASGFQVVAATEKAANDYTTIDYTVPTAIVMGSEEDGVSKDFLKLCDELVAIPIMGSIASLNVSVACGVMLYEVVRQRK
jgi:23S rRNA (guanosine2251-2'-O)-methyltransferase